MPRGYLRKVIRYCLSDDYYLPLYTFVASLILLVTFYLWLPIPSVVWNVQQQAIRNVIYGKKTKGPIIIILILLVFV